MPSPPLDEPAPQIDADPASRRVSSILLICVVIWAIFTFLNGVQGRRVSAAIDLGITAASWGAHRWSRGRPGRREAAAHLATAINGLGLTAVSLIQGQSSAAASWFLVAAPFFAGYTVGARAAKFWAAGAIVMLGVVHLSGLFVKITPEFVHSAPEAWGNAVGLVLALLAFSLASLKAQEEDIARILAREQLIQRQADELARSRDAALAGARARDEFLALMSHEIRTPLNGVLGLTELLAASPLDPEQREQVQTIRDSGAALQVILNDVLDTAKMEAGKLGIDRVDFSPRLVVEQATQLQAAAARKKQLSLSAVVADGLPAALVGDPVRVRQVLLNLLSNAIKFTEAGSILLTVDTRPAGSGDLVHVAVRDTGVGIAPRDLERLFQPFSQVDSSGRRRFEGTGLGLSICRRLARLMGGEVWAESEPGRGSTFHFTFALVPGVAPALDAVSAASDAPLVALVVEDNEVNQRVARGLLTHLGHRCDVVSGGQEALDALAAGSYDVVLMDMRMPGLDGLATTRLIRASPPARRPWIIATTANASAADQQACLLAGMDDFVAKPISLDTLRRALARSAPGPLAVAPDRASGRSDAPAPLVDPLVFGPLRELMGADLPQLLLDHRRDAERLIAALQLAAASSGAEALARAAHELKGAAGSMGAAALQGLCADIERLAREGQLEKACACVDELPPCLDATTRALAGAAGLPGA